MKKHLILILVAIGSIANVTAQSKYSTKTGTITFEASVPSFEEVKAKNENVSAILNTETGDFASLALVKGFRFKVALMEEHFNENYIESSEYPKAVFKGKLQGFSADNLGVDFSEYMLKGTMTLHGQTKELETPIMVKKDGDQLIFKTNFILRPADFNIEIPKIVSSKIAEEVNVSAIYSLSK